MIVSLPSVRLTYGLLAVASLALMIMALFLQEVDGLHPCPLCISQRVAVIAVGIFAALAFVHNPKRCGRRAYAVLQSLAALVGASVAIKHLWIQSLPADQVPACGPSLQYMFDNFPLMDALRLFFTGDGNCAEVQLFLFLPIPAWVLLACLSFLVVNIGQFFREEKTLDSIR